MISPAPTLSDRSLLIGFRRLKRKCPKELPSCSLCIRLEKRCEYPPRVQTQYERASRESVASPKTPDRDAGLQISSSPPEGLHLGLRQGVGQRHGPIQSFPAMFFLDSEICIKPLLSDPYQNMVPTINTPCSLPPEALAVHDEYFTTIHQWLPILSEKRVRRYIAEWRSAPEGPSQLLFLSMKLALEVNPFPRGSKLYMRVLEVLLHVENSYLPCLQLLQSVILISVYELGHAIYPAAYLRIGHASRLCAMMGFHDRKNAAQLFKDTVTWTAREEERRAWWAVFCLDRIINQGINGLPFSTPEPSPGELLPCPEIPWDEGGVGFNEPLFAASFSNNTSLGSFANVCQAAHILGRVLRHRDELHSKNVVLDFRLAEAKQLHSILASLTSHLIDISRESSLLSSSISTSLALCFSARLILYDIYACNEKYSTDHGRSSEEAEMQREAMAGIFDVTRCTWQLARQILDLVEQAGTDGFENANPLLCHCLYAAAQESEWLILEQENSTAGIWLCDMEELLRAISDRWKVAGVYLSEIHKWPGYNSLIKL
ncbi:hypothetical protein F5Y04DRAFT_102078 [Hypomontagnella monticulosa]|nr:hypothetical protein F5Y04DRAFT_102078 [Hypomontagnella monticulosa]